MKIEILGTESLGVRGLCTRITAKDREVVIDPGLALGFLRGGRLPHPLQVYRGMQVRERIVEALSRATDVVISHYHGDHLPLAEANPYQLSMDLVPASCRNARFWCKPIDDPPNDPTDKTSRRYDDLCRALEKRLPFGLPDHLSGMAFSPPQPHGVKGGGLGSVMMTRIAEGGQVFVHASDLQLLDAEAVSAVIDWSPDTVLVSGPPVYLKHLTPAQLQAAWNNALTLAQNVRTVIIDHHLLRSKKGFEWLADLSCASGRRILCAADYMGLDRLPLESMRDELYQEFPVPDGWHEAYAAGKIDISVYRPLFETFFNKITRSHRPAERW
jgi:uncharacterized protein